ncbi:MAG: hypothetical protein P1V81_05995 [Planctomycetota bacterium]|nr:hypothetical protein [Planctomycetota bacterium]
MSDQLIFETANFTAEQASGYRLPGYVIVQLKPPGTQLAALTPAQSAELTACLAEAERLVQELVQPERIYLMKFGELVPQIHFHVMPRTAALAAAFQAETGDQPPFNGARVVAWLWEHHASLGHTDAELADFVTRARASATLG